MSALSRVNSFRLMPTQVGERRIHRYLPYLISGLLLGLSYPSYPYVRLEVLAWVWMVPLLLALKSVHSLSGYLLRIGLTSLIICFVGMSWLMVASVRGGLLVIGVGTLVFTVPFIAFYCVRQTLGWRAALWSAPLIWTAWDWLYHQSEGSFGWIGLWGSQANLYWLVQYVDITGVWGITFWLVLFNVLVVTAVEDLFVVPASAGMIEWRACRLKPVLRTLALICAVMLGVPLSYSAYVFVKAERAGAREISVLLVQPNLDPWDRLDSNKRSTALGKTAALTSAALATQKPDLVIWPETAVPYSLAQEKVAREFLYRQVARWHVPLLTGTLDQRRYDNPTERPPLLKYEGREVESFNAAVLLTPETADGRVRVTSSAPYHKQVLMPFIERVPWSDRYPALARLALNLGAGGGYSAGREAVTFSLRDRQGEPVTVAAAICYEQLYPAKLAEFVRQGAELIAILTNEGWWSRSHGAYQLAAFTRLRAIELRRPIARAANTGLTGLIDPLGRSYAQAPWWSEQSVTGRVRLASELSLYVRYTDYFPKACVWLSLALAVVAIIQRAWQALQWRKPRLDEASTF